MSATPRDVDETMARNDPEGPGPQLREARQRANFSLEDVSTELHLNADTLRALEEDRFDGLPAPAFVRGYIRSYARLLNLPPGPILEAYDQKGFTPPTIVPDITQQPQAKSTDVPVRLATYLVAAGLVVMVVMWWQSREAARVVTNDIAQLSEASPAPLPEAIEPRPLKDGPTEQPLATQFPVDVADATTGSDHGSDTSFDAPASLDSAVPDVVASAADATPLTPAPAEGQATEAMAATTIAPSLTATEPLPDAAPDRFAEPAAETSATEVPPAVPGNRLGLAFEKESWVEVYNGNGDRLVYQLAIDGERMTLDTLPPVRVTLGYAAGAKVTYNGRELDVTPFIRRGTARFVVDANGGARAQAPTSRDSPAETAPATAAAEPELQPQN